MQVISVKSISLYSIISVTYILINIVNIPFPSTTRHCKYSFYRMSHFSPILSCFVVVILLTGEKYELESFSLWYFIPASSSFLGQKLVCFVCIQLWHCGSLHLQNFTFVHTGQLSYKKLSPLKKFFRVCLE
jgi:hypothetical protein